MTPGTISNQRDLFSCSFFTGFAWTNLDRSHSPASSHLLLPELLRFHLRNIWKYSTVWKVARSSESPY